MAPRSLDADLEAWDAWTPAQAAQRLEGVSARWYVLAGWALDLFLGRKTREHADLEIGVSEDEFGAIRAALTGLELVVVGDGKAWLLTETSLRTHFQTWAREAGGPWRLDVIRERWDGDRWVYRRDARVHAAATNAITRTREGIPFISPEIALLFKAKALREKDEVDFATVLPRLDDRRRTWLREALALTHPGHRWLEELL